MKQSARAKSAPQFFACEQTNPINGRRITFEALGTSTEASRSRPRLPGGRDIVLAHEDQGLTRSRLPIFAVGFVVVTTMLRSPTEVERQNESP